MADTAAKQEEPKAAGLLESAEDAAKHRKERGEEEPMSPQKSGLGRHVDIGGVGDFGPVDTERMAKQRDERDMPARVP
ncbi:hypothetical protein ABPG75_007334 [Micractinium tetrahymenae]